MALESPPAFLQASSYGAEQTRRAIFVGAYQAGVKQWSDMAVTVNSGLQLTISSGEALVPGTGSTSWSSPETHLTPSGTQGYYYVDNQSNASVTLANADPSNPRVDAVVVTVQDAAYAGASNQVIIQKLTGTATGGATLANLNGAPTIPASSLVLAYALVPASAGTPSGIAYQAIPFAQMNPPSVLTVNLTQQTLGAAGTYTSAILGGSSGLPYPGLWLVTVTNYVTVTSGSGYSSARITLQANGTGINGGRIRGGIHSSFPEGITLDGTFAYQGAVGDQLTLAYLNNGSSASSLAFATNGAGNPDNVFQATWIGPGQLSAYVPGN